MVQCFRKNKWIFIVLIIELIFLLGLGLKNIITPLYTNYYGSESIAFSYQEMGFVTEEEDGSYTIASDGGAPESNAWTFNNISLSAGTYHIRVNYRAQDIISGETDSKIMVSDNTIRNYFSQDILTISNYSNFTETTILLGAKTDSLNIAVYYGGEGSLNISGLYIQEDAMARLGIVLQWFALFAVIDFFFVLLLCDDLCDSKKRQQIFVSACVIGFASFPMISDTLSGGHDLPFHIARIKGIADEILLGNIPVRIYSMAYNGYGYPSSIFYCDILMYFPAILYILGVPLFRVYQLYVVFINTLTYVIAYRCFSNMFENEESGMCGASLYTLSLYRIVCLYSRAAVGEYSAMAFYPLVIYGMWLILGKHQKSISKNGWIWLSLGITGVVFTHIISTEMVLIFCLITCLIFVRRVLKRDVFLQLLKAGILTILLTSWFLYPLFEYMQGHYYVDTEGVNSIGSSGLYLSQIFSFFSTYTGHNQYNSMQSEMALSIGPSLTLCLVLFIWYRIKNGKDKAELYSLGSISTVLGVIALWFTSIYFPWDDIKNIHGKIAEYLYIIQFPWRYLAIASVFLAITGTCMFWLIKKESENVFRQIISVLLIIAICLPIGYYYTNYLNTVGSKQYLTLSDSISCFDRLYLPASTPLDSFGDDSIYYDEGLIIENQERDGDVIAVSCRNESDKDLTLALPLIYYRNYVAKDSNKQYIQVGCGIKNRVTVSIPPGFDDTVYIRFEIPLKWRLVEMISIFSALGLGTSMCITKVIQRRCKRRYDD